MQAKIYCKPAAKDVHEFQLIVECDNNISVIRNFI